MKKVAFGLKAGRTPLLTIMAERPPVPRGARPVLSGITSDSKGSLHR